MTRQQRAARQRAREYGTVVLWFLRQSCGPDTLRQADLRIADLAARLARVAAHYAAVSLEDAHESAR